MLRFLAISYILLLSVSLIGQQVCEGSLGDNIFESGDFGSGTINIPFEDPKIAPGYIYTTNPPPSDGYYSLTNNTGRWTNLYPTWLEIQDNSNDEDGYMMVVNASYEPGIFYEETITGLCENTFYEFSADIINMIKIGTPNHLDPSVDFLLDGEVKYSTGNIPKTEKWNKYGFTFTTDATQSEIKLTLRNNAPGGIGNDLALDNISFRPCGPKSFIELDADETVFLCLEDDPLLIDADIVGASGQEFSLYWEQSTDGVNWVDMSLMNVNQISHDIFIPGTYYYRYISAANDANLNNQKCRIISDILRIEVLPRLHFYQDSLCEGSIYDFNGRNISDSGIYIDTLISSFGCDSVVTLDLRLVPFKLITSDIMVDDPSCHGDVDGQVVLNNTTGGYGSYTYSLDGIGNSMDFLNLKPGNYLLNIVDRYGCSVDYDVELIDPELFSIDIGPDEYVLLGEELHLRADANFTVTTVTWTPSEYFDCMDCQEVTALPFDDGYLKVKAYNLNGCVAVDSLYVNVDKENSVFIPNIFSPNEDGINDIFEINAIGNAVSSILKFYIIDRWGGVVYSRQNIGLGDLNVFWDGNVGGKHAPAGVYTYLVEVNYLDGSQGKITGNITLLR